MPISTTYLPISISLKYFYDFELKQIIRTEACVNCINIIINYIILILFLIWFFFRKIIIIVQREHRRHCGFPLWQHTGTITKTLFWFCNNSDHHNTTYRCNTKIIIYKEMHQNINNFTRSWRKKTNMHTINC